MAILKPSATFQGSDGSRNSYSLFKKGIKVIDVAKYIKQPTGTYVFILPPYKLDAEGNGVWHYRYDVRRNFGLEQKESFFETTDSPIRYFSIQAWKKYPDLCRRPSIMKDGKEIKQYPEWGNTQSRTAFNSIYSKKPMIDEGIHALDIPDWKCADNIFQYHNDKTADGETRDLICDPEKGFLPVFLKLDGFTWTVTIDSKKTYKISESFMDSNNMYQLDDIFVKKSNEELLEKLSRIVHPDMFKDCMEGYTGVDHPISMYVDESPKAGDTEFAGPEDVQQTPATQEPVDTDLMGQESEPGITDPQPVNPVTGEPEEPVTTKAAPNVIPTSKVQKTEEVSDSNPMLRVSQPPAPTMDKATRAKWLRSDSKK